MADEEELSDFEVKCRKVIVFSYRFVFATLLSYQLFDFLFSPIWMHGSLNLPIGKDMSDKTAGYIVEHQFSKVGFYERIANCAASVAFVGAVLHDHTVWQLLRLSLLCGFFSGLGRCIQLQHRLFSAFHDIFYAYIHFFLVGLCLTIQKPRLKEWLAKMRKRKTDAIDSADVDQLTAIRPLDDKVGKEGLRMRPGNG